MSSIEKALPGEESVAFGRFADSMSAVESLSSGKQLIVETTHVCFTNPPS